MRLGRAAAILVVAGLAGLASALPARAGEPAQREATAPANREIMVMLKLGADHYRPGGDYGGAYGDAMGQQARLRLARSIAREHGLTIVTSWPMPLIGVDCVIMAVGDDRPLDKVTSELSSVRGVEWSQPLQQFEVQGGASQPARQPYNDRLYPAQSTFKGWNLASIHRLATGRGVTIAIVDSRIDIRHPDLTGQIADVENFASQGQQGPEWHGTGVAGIIAARPNNALGIAGVAPGARVIGLRACWEGQPRGKTVCDSFSIAKALSFAIQKRVDILNMSLTGPRDRLLETLITLGLSRGIIVVAAVDDKKPETSFPAMISGVIPVADQSLSARSPAVYIAPGLDIPTTEPNGKWSLVSGSSYAAAHVSGLAALVHQLSGASPTHSTGAAMFGPRGPISACAAIARVSRLDEAACRTQR